MGKLAFVHNDGTPLESKQPPAPSPEVEEPSLAEIAAREAARVSTKRFTDKVDNDV